MKGHQQGCVGMTTGIFAGLWDVLPCTNKEKYICKHLAEGAGLTPAPPTLTPTNCAIGWTRMVSRNYCYQVQPRLKKLEGQIQFFQLNLKTSYIHLEIMVAKITAPKQRICNIGNVRHGIKLGTYAIGFLFSVSV